MKWIEALKEWNKGNDKWCIPRKGSDAHMAVRAIMGEKPKADAPKKKGPKIAPKAEPKVKEPKAPKVKEPKAPKEKDSPEVKNAKTRYFQSISNMSDRDERIAKMDAATKKQYDAYMKKPVAPKKLASYASYS